MGKTSVRVAVDVGGTFTDVVLTDLASGRIAAAKVLTTPEDRGIGVLSGIKNAFDTNQLDLSAAREVVHGSTTGTNALIERTGAVVGFLTTEGFRDMLEIGRVQRPMEGLYDISVDRPPPLVPRHRCFTVRERIIADSSVLIPLDEDGVRAAAARFRKLGVQAVAICFLSSYLNPVHEMRAAEILAEELPDCPISISSQLSPEYREYERASTAVINAYLTPVMGAYLDSLVSRIASDIGDVPLYVIQANGGSTSVDNARTRAVTTVNSGPAGGVVAAAYYGRLHQRDKIVSVDMGGTSFDIGLIEDGVSKVTTEGAFQGLPVKIPIIDLHIIGAGGGSVAWIDPGGALNVGPRSAGAEPGPACYGQGGEEPTVTDANLVLGRLNPGYFNGGRMTLDGNAARTAVSGLAEKLGLGLEETALGIIKVVNANMAKGIASVTIQRGIDVRDFSLFSFGGAGGAHAVDLARELTMTEAIVPPMPGTFSALGLLVTEMRHDYVTALGGVTSDEVKVAELEAAFLRMEAQGARELETQGFDAGHIRLARFADLKVVGQTYELSLPVSGTFDDDGLVRLIQAFGDLYRERYAFFFEGEPIELVNLRVSALGVNEPLVLPSGEAAGTDPS
ncbi:MAG: hydantoinase/oxoprolinase family protein, partial [Proteobacteria bacterium]|nr:hydantoinase/oxoprolinase family protein [Pseudomonadota bacterium]